MSVLGHHNLRSKNKYSSGRLADFNALNELETLYGEPKSILHVEAIYEMLRAEIEFNIDKPFEPNLDFCFADKDVPKDFLKVISNKSLIESQKMLKLSSYNAGIKTLSTAQGNSIGRDSNIWDEYISQLYFEYPEYRSLSQRWYGVFEERMDYEFLREKKLLSPKELDEIIFEKIGDADFDIPDYSSSDFKVIHESKKNGRIYGLKYLLEENEGKIYPHLSRINEESRYDFEIKHSSEEGELVKVTNLDGVFYFIGRFSSENYAKKKWNLPFRKSA